MKPNDRLARIVAGGKKRFILRYGVLGWGMPCAVLFAAWTYYSETNVGVMDIVFLFIIFPVGGIAWGASMWRFLKKRHDKAMADVGKIETAEQRGLGKRE